jgi:hypothetical protein
VVRWRHQRQEWMEREFEFLREAAMAAGRVGYYLLIQSLERAYRDVAGKVLPHLEADAVNRWAEFAFFALEARNVQALRTELPPLMRANDRHVLRGLAAACRTQETLKDHPTSQAHHAALEASAVDSSTPEPVKPAPEVCRPAPTVGERRAEELAPEVEPSAPAPGVGGLCLDEASPAVSLAAPVPLEAEPGATGATSVAGQSAPVPAEEAGGVHEPYPKVGPSAPLAAEARGAGALFASWSGCQTRSGKRSPDRALPEPASGNFCHLPPDAVLATSLSSEDPTGPGAQALSAEVSVPDVSGG